MNRGNFMWKKIGQWAFIATAFIGAGSGAVRHLPQEPVANTSKEFHQVLDKDTEHRDKIRERDAEMEAINAANQAVSEAGAGIIEQNEETKSWEISMTEELNEKYHGYQFDYSHP